MSAIIDVFPFEVDGENAEYIDGAALSKLLAEAMRSILDAHSGRTLAAAGEGDSPGAPKIDSEDVAAAVGTVKLAGEKRRRPSGVFIFNPQPIIPYQLRPALTLQSGQKINQVVLAEGDRQILSWQLVQEMSEDQQSDIKELAYLLIFDIARAEIRGTASYVGTNSLDAFRWQTEALKKWLSKEFDIKDPNDVQAVYDLLQKAIDADPTYALAYYNQGILTHRTYRSPDLNQQALDHFLQAVEVARSSQRPGQQEIEAMAWLGAANAYSQMVHRYGKEDDEAVIQAARDAAANAILILGETPKTLVALAFALHCTDRLEDIEDARVVYHKVLKKNWGKYSLVHNNYGYIMMVGGDQLEKLGRKAEAHKWYAEAETHFKIAGKLASKGSRIPEFIHDNLGILYRLQKQYEKSIDEHMQAMVVNPEFSVYTNGLNHFAQALLARRDEEEEDIRKAINYHRLALRSTADRRTNLKSMREIVSVLAETNFEQLEAIQALYEETTGSDRLDTEEWLTKLWALMRVQEEEEGGQGGRVERRSMLIEREEMIARPSSGTFRRDPSTPERRERRLRRATDNDADALRERRGSRGEVVRPLRYQRREA